MEYETTIKNNLLFAVAVDPTTFVKSSSGSIVGVVYVKVGDYAFPFERWDDYVDVVELWMNNAAALLEGKTARCTCLFMDGPYQFDITAQYAESWTMQFINNSDSDNLNVLKEIAIEPQVVVDALLGASEAIIEAIEKRDWETPYLKGLRDSRMRLEQQRQLATMS